jgi:heme-degrading monooxygenase HmoA
VHARVSTYETDDAERLIDGFQNVSGELEQVEGFSHAYFLVDRTNGKAVSVTIWESEEALTESQRKADELRKQGTEPSGSSIKSVEHYEVSHTVGSPTPART